jgi:deoxyribodipyrimidine photolyase-related protein
MGLIRNLVVILGDQLDEHSSALDGFHHGQDLVFMAEVSEESTHVWSHRARITMFLSAMRHFRDRISDRACVWYRHLDDEGNRHALDAELAVAIQRFEPERVIVTEPGDYRVREAIESTCRRVRKPLEIRPDRHFLCSLDQFRAHAAGRKQLRLEYFYREMRRRTGFLMNGDEPEGGQWNFDADNRKSFPKEGPGPVPSPVSFPPDEITKNVMRRVRQHFETHPGELNRFDFPVTREQALAALQDFIAHRLPRFGEYQDAMWQGEPYLFHARLSAALNLKLLHPREVCQAAETAYRAGHAPLAAVEGFIRQIIGWREYVRGIYWTYMPEYATRNALNATGELPDFYWTGDTEMNCLRQTIQQTLQTGYAHHIQRLMVTGLYALLAGVDPAQVHQWYLAVYVDAVEWVELPNTLGMSQFADGGVMASKPYAATGKYIQRMSNYCTGCPYRPEESTGENACPFTTLYWDFLMRHEDRLRRVGRMDMQLRNLVHLEPAKRAAIRERAQSLRAPSLTEA